MGCRASVEAELEEVAGVRTVHADLVQQTASIVFDPVTTDVPVFRAAIEQAGYRPKSEITIRG